MYNGAIYSCAIHQEISIRRYVTAAVKDAVYSRARKYAIYQYTNIEIMQ